MEVAEPLLTPEVGLTQIAEFFEFADAGLAIADPRGNLIRANQLFCTLTGLQQEALAQRSVADLLPEGTVTGVEPRLLPLRWERVFGTRPVEIGIKFMTDGSILVTATPSLAAPSEIRLLELQESLSLAMQSGKLGVWTRDLRTGRVEWSPELAAIFGITAEEFTKSEAAFFSFVHPEDQSVVTAAVEESLRTGDDYTVEFRFIRKDGWEGWMEGRGRTVSDGAGRPILIAGVGIDITARKEAEQELRILNESARSLGGTLNLPEVYDRLQAIVSKVMDCDNMVVSSFDPQEGALTCSYAWMEGSRADTSIFPPLTLAPEGRGLQSAVIRTGESLRVNDAEAARKRSVTSYVIDPDGTLKSTPQPGRAFTQSILMVPIKLEGQVIGVVQVMSNRLDAYTEQHLRVLEGVVQQMAVAVQNAKLYAAAQHEISERRRLEEQLELRVQERTAELQRANVEMEGFTYTVSHDLRAPLRAITSASMILLEDFGSQVTPEAKSELKRMASAANRLGRLIDDLLQYSRLGRAELVKRPIDLSELAQEVADSVRNNVDHYAKGATIEPALSANADPQLLRLAMENLIDNAFKYGASQVCVGKIDATDRPVFYVKDDGIGFDPRYSHKVFQPFERLVHEQEYPGTGIGLANVKRIIEQHGGRVWAESEPGAGSVFYFTLC